MTININSFKAKQEYIGNKVNINNEWSSTYQVRENATSGDVGKLIPIFYKELTPSQSVDLSSEVAINFQPFVSQLFHQFTIIVKTYFVPYRIIDTEFEEFIQGGVDGKNAYLEPHIDLKELKENHPNKDLTHTIIDYFGYPINNNFINAVQPTDEVKPRAYPVRVYNKVYNDQIRNIDIMPEEIAEDNIETLKAYWGADYYTVSQVYRQRGIAPNIPLEGINAIGLEHKINGAYKQYVPRPIDGKYETRGWRVSTDHTLDMSPEYKKDIKKSTIMINGTHIPSTINSNLYQQYIEDHEINLENIGININEMYMSMGIMANMMNNARIKPRYVDMLKERFGIERQDARLQMAEYITMDTFDITSQGIVQTAYGDVTNGQTPQGYITSQATAQNRGTRVNYTAQEHGAIISILEIKPNTAYEGGLENELRCKDRFEYVTSELVNMPSVAIRKGELYYNASEKDAETFSWTGIYDEKRTMLSTATGRMRPTGKDTLKSFTLTRAFGEHPSYNQNFVECNADMDRVKQYITEPDFQMYCKTEMRTSLPIPLQSNPAELFGM